MLPIADEAPKTLAEWETLVNNTFLNGQEQYGLDVAKAKADAEARWDQRAGVREAELARAARAEISARTNADGSPLTDAQKQALFEAADKEIAAILESEKAQALADAAGLVNVPPTREQVEITYACYRPQPAEKQARPEGFSTDSFYRLTDGRVYSVADAAFVNGRAAQDAIDVPGGTERDLKDLLVFYRDKPQGYPDLIIAGSLLTTEELFARLRAARDRRIAATDYLMCSDYPLGDAARLEVQTYRTALRDLPALEGAPWDGGGEGTPWPAMPEAVK